MIKNTMFDTLLQLPLFQGLCHEDLTAIIEKIKLQFTRYKHGNTVIEQGSINDKLTFLLKGEVAVITTSKDGTFTITEYISAPAVIEPQTLFGMHINYTSSYIAKTEVNTVSICKSYILNGLMKYDIFRLNYMNIISTYAQLANSRLWSNPPNGIEERIIHFILSHTEKHIGEKSLKIKMEDLARYVDGTRLSVSKALNSLHEKKFIELKRREIYIPEVSKLLWVISKVDCIIY